MIRLFTVVCLMLATGAASCHAAFAADSVGGDDLRTAIAGKTVHVTTPIGTVPVSFRSDGTMSGRSSGVAAYAMAAADQGRWWVIGDRLCQQWAKWFNKATHCFSMRREGRTLYWSGSGRSGVATIAN
ncbi:unnamed protein product [Phaeothamnion confervicola]